MVQMIVRGAVAIVAIGAMIVGNNAVAPETQIAVITLALNSLLQGTINTVSKKTAEG